MRDARLVVAIVARGEGAIHRAQSQRTVMCAIHGQGLVLKRERFGHNRAGTAWLQQPDADRQEVEKEDGDIARRDIVASVAIPARFRSPRRLWHNVGIRHTGRFVIGEH